MELVLVGVPVADDGDRGLETENTRIQQPTYYPIPLPLLEYWVKSHCAVALSEIAEHS